MLASYKGKIGGAENYQNALDTGAAHRLDFGVQVCILEVVREHGWQFTDYRVRVLEGALKDVEGWVDYATINGDDNGGIQQPSLGCQ